MNINTETVSLFFTGVSLIGGGIIYMITQLHKIDKKVKSTEEINEMIDLKIFKHVEKCRTSKKESTNEQRKLA